MDYLIYILVGVVGMIVGRYFALRQGSGQAVRRKCSHQTFASKSESEMNDIREEAREALSERTEGRKEKILELFRDARNDFKAGCNLREGENKKGITSNDVEKLLDVSNNTARKYLNELEDEGKIEQVGDAGRGVYYVLR